MKHLIGFMYSILAVIVVTSSVLLYWLYQPYQVLSPNPVIKVTSVEDAHLVILSATYCKNLNAKGTVRISFVGSTIEELTPMATEAQPKQCYDKQQIPIIVPQDLPVGKYYIKFSANYKINPLRTFTTIYQSESFEVQ